MGITHLPLVAYMRQWFRSPLAPNRRQAIILIRDGLLSIGPLGTNFSEILIKIQNLSFQKMLLKISSAKWRPFCPGGDELKRFPLRYNALPSTVNGSLSGFLCTAKKHWFDLIPTQWIFAPLFAILSEFPRGQIWTALCNRQTLYSSIYFFLPRSKMPKCAETDNYRIRYFWPR